MDNNMVIAHLDLAQKLESSSASTDPNSVEKLMHKVDKWCEKVYSNVSINGMCVVLFAGRKSNLKSKLENKDSDSDKIPPSDNSPYNKSDKDMDADSTSTSQDENQNTNSSSSNSNPIPQNTSQLRSRRNGVCFIRINTAK
jgi:hypothetical protein